MRVTSNNFTENLISQFHSLAGRQVNLQNQVSTGQRLQEASDDPFAAQQVLDLRDQSTALAQYRRNIENHREYTNLNHGAMRSLQKVLDRVQEIAATIDDLDSPADMQSYAAEVDQLLRHALDIANTKHRGDHLFAGTKADSTPFAAATGSSGRIMSVSFQGSVTVPGADIAAGVSVSSRIPGGNSSGAGDRGLLNDSRFGVDFFGQIIALRDQLESGNVDAIQSGTRSGLQAAEENLLFHIASNGALQARLESSLSSAKEEALGIEKEISLRADIDLPEAILRLNQQQTNFQAALQSASSVLNLSLLTFLR